MISAAVGVTVVLALLLVSIQILLGLWAGSRAAAMAHDAARLVAEADDPGEGAARARAHVASLEPDAQVSVDIAGSPPQAVVTVVVPGPTLLSLDPLPHGAISRTSRVPLERWVPA